MKKKILQMLFLLAVFTTSALAQKTVTGVVTDDLGEALPGVTVMIAGTSTGTVTNLSGAFSIEVPDENSILKFSFIGMEAQEVIVGSQTVMNITLATSSLQMDEVIITALGISRDKKSLGYSIADVKGEDLNNTPQDNVLTSLSGKVAGVRISQMGGLAGSSVNVIIRGSTSLNSDNQPLFVIDGVPVANSLNNFYQGADMGNAISDINTEDIETISVLKGPSAAALYGSRAGNGVVLITTKTGSSSTKGIGVDFNTAVTFETPLKYIEYQTEFGPGKAGVHMFEESENESWGSRLDGTPTIQWDTDGVAAPLLSYDNRLTDFFQTGSTYTNNISVNGNYDEGSFRLSIGDVRNTGVVPNTDFSRSSVGLNGSYNVTPKLKVQGSISVTESGSDNRIVVDGGREDIVRSVYEMSAHVNILDLQDYWQPGQENIQQLKYKHKQNNPWFVVNENLIGFSRDRTVSKLQFDWELLDDLTLTGRYSRDNYTQSRSARSAFSTYGQWDGGYETQSNYATESNLDLMLTYNKSINEVWDINAVAGANDMSQFGRALSNEAESLVVPDLYTMSNGLPGTVTYGSSWYEKTIYGLYGMASIGYNKMIYLDLTARNDWSSTLPKENRSYFYPSTSLSVLVSEMLDLPKWLTFAKLRGGVAQVGNDVGPYRLQQYFSTAQDWGASKRMYMGGGLRNTSLKPEIATSKEIGFDLKFLNNRLGLDATYYVVENKNQVLSIGLPLESGATSKQINAGLIQSKGWEIGITSTPVIARDFKWDVNASISRDRTKIVELAEGIDYFHFGKVGTAIVRTYVGETIGDIYQQPLLTVEDESSPYFGYPLLNSGGQYQKNGDMEKLEKIGNSNHDFILGLQSTIRYKSFSLFANIDWRQGGGFFSRTMTFFSNNGQRKFKMQVRHYYQSYLKTPFQAYCN